MVAQYKYDPFGRRIEKNVNGDIKRYVYDGPNIVVDYNGNGNLKNAYIHNLTIDDPLALQQGANIYYYHKDGLGSITNLTDTTGSLVKSYTYKSFGEIYSQTGTVQQPFTFTAREYDPESGLYYYRARYYDPKTGRFWTKDPIGFAGGDVNLYRAVGNNTINLADPLGLQWYKSPAVWLDIGALTSDIGSLGYPPLFVAGIGFSLASTIYTYYEYEHGQAEWYDFLASAATTIVGLYPYPPLFIGADVAILIYDIYRAESQSKSCK
jgi:RHS repeat-associated protein